MTIFLATLHCFACLSSGTHKRSVTGTSMLANQSSKYPTMNDLLVEMSLLTDRGNDGTNY